MKQSTFSAVMANSIKNLLQGYTKGIRFVAVLTILLTLGIGQAWGLGYNNESHVYLDVNGTTKYYKVSNESWSTGCTLEGTWGGNLSQQTFNDVCGLKIVGGAIGGWTSYGETLSGTLSFAVTQSSVTPTSWNNFGSISRNSTYNGNNAFYYEKGGSTDVTPTVPGTYYLHIKISFNSISKTSYAKFTIPTYTVAGNEAVLGSEWKQDDTNNDMTLASGTTYTLTKSNVILKKGITYECKVVKNHAWNESWPAENVTYSVDADGHYDVTFSFDYSNKNVVVTTTRLYAVIYNGNDNNSGSVPTTSYHSNGSTVKVANNSGNLAKTGYTFGGWNTNPEGNGTNYIAGSGTFKMSNVDKTLYAKWTPNQYTVTLDNRGATTAGQASVTATYNAAMPSIANNLPKKTDYTFNGYFDAASGGTQYYKADGISARTWNKTANTTLYAQWTLNTYTVTWVVDKSTTTEPVDHGSKVEKAPTIDPNNPPCGDKFVGWTTEFYAGKSKPETLYPTAADIPAVTGDVTYYAVFADYVE